MKILMMVLVLLAAACGGDESVASKSAAAYREAQAKGVPVRGGHDHGHQTGDTTAMDHSAHGTADAHAGHDMTAGATAMDHAAHGAHDAAGHAAMGHGSTGHAAHGQTPGGAHAQHGTAARASGGHAGHQTTSAPAGHDQHAGMQHAAPAAGADPHAQHRPAATGTQTDHGQHGGTPSTTTADPHAQHRTASAPARSVTAAAPRSNTDMRNVQPSSTLQPDAFDAPAPASVSEAAKAAQGGGHEGHQMRGITPGTDRENPPTPMPATRDRTNPPAPATDHSQHGAAQQAAAVYTCPMHPEVTSDKPGTCPKCGMALVKKN